MREKSSIKFYFFVIALGSYLCSYLGNPEIFHSIIVGNWIFSHQALPTTYLWSSASKDIFWLDSSWLFNLLISLIETNYYWTGLALLKVTLSILFIFFFSNFLTLIFKDFFVAGLISTIVGIGVLENSGLNPELFIISFLPLLLIFIKLFFAEKKKKLSFFSFFILCLILANIHFTFIYLLSAAIILLFPKDKKKKDLLFLFLAGLLAVILSPYGSKNLFWIYQQSTKNLTYYLANQELAANIFEYPFVCMILLWSIIFVFIYSLQNIKNYFKELVFSVVLTIFSFALKTFIPFTLIVLGYLLINLWKDAVDNQSNIPLQKVFNVFGEKLSRLSYFGVIWILFCVALVNIENLRRLPLVTFLLPEREMDYILEKKLAFPLWNQSAIAPYLIYRLANEKGEPGELVAMDQTAILNNPQLIREESHKMWRKSFAANSPKTVLVNYYSTLYDALIHDPQWKLVWQNDKEVSSQGQETEEKIPFYAWAIFVNS